MNKRPQSIDGFVLRRRSDTDNNDLAPRSERITFNREVAPKKVSITENGLENDIESSLDGLTSGDNHKLAQVPEEFGNISSRAPKQLSRKERKARKKALALQKKHRKLKKFAKWFAILVPIVVLVIVGFLFIKALMAGGQVFKGNILDAFTSKTKLQEDENGWTNILIMSTSGYSMSSSAWDGANLTDSIMVLSVNQQTNQSITMSIPRDLWVTYADFNETCPLLGTSGGKLNTVYECGSNNGNDQSAGAQALMSAVGYILGLKIQYYVHPNWTALEKIVDAVGGVDVSIKSTDPTCEGGYGIYDIATGVKYPEGTAHLDGSAALALARARNDAGGCGLASGNFDRENYQREILAAVQKKAVSVGTILNPTSVNSLIDAIGGNLYTNFKSSEIQTLISLAKTIKNPTSIPFNDRSNNLPDLFTTGTVSSQSVVLPMTYNSDSETDDYSAIQAYVAQNMSSNPVTKEGAVVDVLNGSGVTGAASDESKTLKSAGFVTGSIANAPTNITDKVEIFDLSGGKMSATSAALSKKYGVKVQSGAIGDLAGYTSSDDASFALVVGPGLVTTTTDSSSSE